MKRQQATKITRAHDTKHTDILYVIWQLLYLVSFFEHMLYLVYEAEQNSKCPIRVTMTKKHHLDNKSIALLKISSFRAFT